MGLGRRSACGTRALRLMATVVVSPFDVANFPEGGGHFWVYMQYAQGLRRLGCDVYWLEQFRHGRDKVHDARAMATFRSEEHTSELQSLAYLVCRLLLEKKK